MVEKGAGMEQKFRLMLARFPYGGEERHEIANWVAAATGWAARNDFVSAFLLWEINDTPITMCRNQAVEEAIRQKVDFLVMLDSDMVPDINKAKPFLPTAFEFAVGRYASAPTIVAAPYCTAPPDQLPTMGRWRTFRDGFPVKADLYTREEAANFTGITAVPFLGTGLMLIDMRVFTGFGGLTLPMPWFEYEWTTAARSAKATTEDMYFTRNVATLFAKIGLDVNHVAWDCWAYHVKKSFIGKPVDLTPLALHNLVSPPDITVKAEAEPVIAQAEPTNGQQYIAGLHERLRGFNGA